MCERAPPIAITHCPDAWDAGAQLIVNDEVLRVSLVVSANYKVDHELVT